MAIEGEEFRVDVDQVLKDKLGKKSKFVPKFLVSWLKRIIHQDWMNVHLCGEGKGQVGVEWLDGCLNYLNCTLNVRTNIDGVIQEGLDALPGNEGGRYFTIVSNHPLGGQDGIALGSIICHKYDSQMVYLVNDILMSFKGLAPLCVPINKTGHNSRNFPKMVEAAFQSPKNVVMFPAGLCSRKGEDGVIKDIEWKKTFIAKSVQYHRPLLQHSPLVQAFAHQVQHCHALLGRRDVQESGENLHGHIREAYSMADIRQVENSFRVGAMGERESLST